MTLFQGCADLHIHTSASDGRYQVTEVLKHIATQRPNLNVIAITDHDTLDASLWAYEQKHRFSFDIVPGVEVSSRGGHILGLWVTTPIARRMSLEDTVSAIHEAGGIAILAHPFDMMMDDVRLNARRYLRNPQVLLQAGLDGVEVHNAGIITPMSTVLARHLAQRAGLAMLGNSDAHTLGAIGTGRTRFTGVTASDLRRAILLGDTRAEGSAWNISDYIEYLQTERRSRQRLSLANITS
jgi:predicted metal-dependent phosphoesterase TrpH